MKIARRSGELLVVYAPELFDRPDFVTWLNRGSGDPPNPSDRVATWHRPSDGEPTESSDLFVTYDGNGDIADGSNSDMPGWDDLVKLISREVSPWFSGVVWLINQENTCGD
jgi:hypothetical protein